MARWLLFVPPAVFGLLGGLLYTGMMREDPDALPSAIEGHVAPPLTASPLGDMPSFDSATLAQPGVKLVNFWASWCAPCRAEHPLLTELAAEGITIYGINYRDQPGQAQKFLGDLGNPYKAIVADPTGRSGIDWGLYGVPETFVIDGTGKVVLRFAGPITRQELERKIRPAIAAAQ